MRRYSSKEIVAALKRLGCAPRWQATHSRKNKGSHQTFTRNVAQPDGTVRKRSTPILLGKKEMDEHTLKGALDLLEISVEDFEGAVR